MDTTDKTLCLTAARVLEEWAKKHAEEAAVPDPSDKWRRAASSARFTAVQIRWALEDIARADGSAT